MTQFACECGKAFPKKQGLVMHQRSKHPKPYEPPTTQDVAAFRSGDIQVPMSGLDEVRDEAKAFALDDLSPERPYVAPTVKAVTVIEPSVPKESSRWDKTEPVGTLEPADGEDISFLVDPTTAQGGIPFNTGRARARDALAAEREEQRDIATFVTEPPPAPVAPEPRLNVAPQPGKPPPRRRFDNVRERCRNGYPEGMDAKWLVDVVDYADQVLQLVAQPHVYDRWIERLTE